MIARGEHWKKGQDKIQTLEQQQQQLSDRWSGLHELYLREYQVDLNELSQAAESFLAGDTNTEPTSEEIDTTHGSAIGQTHWLGELLADPRNSKSKSEFDRVAIEADVISSAARNCCQWQRQHGSADRTR